jgi:DNA polymerase
VLRQVPIAPPSNGARARDAEPVGSSPSGSSPFGSPLEDSRLAGSPPSGSSADRGWVRGAPVASPRSTPAERALAAAGQAESLEALRAALAGFDGCALRETASHLVWAEGDPQSGLLLIGAPPGADEDRAGTPFAGREGALLDQMLASIGLSRPGLLLAPLIPWRPPGGRSPNPGELAQCLPFLHRLVVLAEPRRIVLLGGLATRSLLGATAGRRRGSVVWLEWSVPGSARPVPVPVLALPGLGALLKTPALRKDAWAGLRLLRRALDAEPAVTSDTAV